MYFLMRNSNYNKILKKKWSILYAIGKKSSTNVLFTGAPQPTFEQSRVTPSQRAVFNSLTTSFLSRDSSLKAHWHFGW